WASAGDGENADAFTFVCQGTADEEAKALSLAAARCNEKLCRLFGVKLRSQLSVKEDLNGLEAKSEVSETCDVQVQGRKTLNKGGECGPSGCTYWLRQSYPRASYDEEKARLSQPTIVRQEVVIQEGDKHYRDPAACEQNLRAYGKVEGTSAEAFRSRKAFLGKALGSCEGIDGRDSGLFVTLNTLLLTPLDQFTLAVPDGDAVSRPSERLAFTLAPKSWRSSLDTDRFLTQRIAKVQKLVDGAILPLTLLELGDRGGTAAEVEAAMAQVVRYPFVKTPASVHHFYYLHDLALGIGQRGRAPVSPRYRRFLLDQVARSNLSCSYKKNVPGEKIVAYFAYDGEVDEEEWQAAMKLGQGGEPNDSSMCLRALIKPLRGAQRGPRLDQVGEKIASGAWPASDQFRLFGSLLDYVEPGERLPLFLRYEARLTGKADRKADVISDVVRAAFGWDFDYVNGKPEERAAGLRACGEMPKRIGSFLRDHPEAKSDDSGLCLCLRLEGLSPAQRKALVAELIRYGDKPCGEIKAEDWPEEYYSVKEPETRKSLYAQETAIRGRADVLKAPMQACLEQHSILKQDYLIDTYLTVRSSRGRFSGAAARVTIVGELKELARKGNARGYINAKEIRAMQQNLEACITQAANAYSLPATLSVAQVSETLRLWFQFSGAHNERNGYVK
ncbi:MAG TPA: hypothetical protein VIW29_00590, partial [Polyangiaceae bacterium]